MTKIIVAVCENKECAKNLYDAGQKLNIDVKYEIQSNGTIENEVELKYIKEATAILFATDEDVENIEGIERFIDCEYYEVDCDTAINKADIVIKEIIDDLN